MLIIQAMDYRQWLLASTMFVPPAACWRMSVKRSVIEKIKAHNAAEAEKKRLAANDGCVGG